MITAPDPGPTVVGGIRRRSTVVLLLVAACTLPVTACSGSSHATPPTGVSTTSSVRATRSGLPQDPCTFVTRSVIDAARFKDKVVRATASKGVGISVCKYADDPNPRDIAASSLYLLIKTPVYLAQHKLTAGQGAREAADACQPGSAREWRAGRGLGSYAYFCVGRPGSSRGGWVQNGQVYNLAVGSEFTLDASVSDKLDQFVAVARAISANIGR